MTDSEQKDIPKVTNVSRGILRRGMIIVGVLVLFLLSIDMMSTSFKLLGKDTAQDILTVASNPFIGLFIGLLITAIIQSSSTSTALMVTAVASGSLTVESAIPMVLGANIGTTLTSTIVALGYLTRKKEFRKAISAAFLHDVFNILVVVILFPLEYYYGVLSHYSGRLVEVLSLGGDGDATGFNFRLWDILPMGDFITWTHVPPFIFLLLSFVFLMLTIKYVSQALSGLLIGDSRDRMRHYLFLRPGRSFFWGTLFTAGIQSSSITTSLIVPFVATGKVALKNAFPFLMGANLGTTITAFIAASFQSEAAISLAVAHLLINLFGVILFFLPYLKELPIYLANQFGRLASKYRLTVFVYITFTFFLVPFSLIKLHESQADPVEELPSPAVAVDTVSAAPVDSLVVDTVE